MVPCYLTLSQPTTVLERLEINMNFGGIQFEFGHVDVDHHSPITADPKSQGKMLVFGILCLIITAE